MESGLIEFLSDVFLFKSVEKSNMQKTLDDLEIRLELKAYAKQDVIYYPKEYEKKIGFVIEGECAVQRIKSDGDFIPLNILRRFDSFGIMAILSDSSEYPTRIVASKSAKIIFINEKDFLKLIEFSSQISMNVIKFLSQKIEFLNHKIATFSADSVEEKFTNYILLKCKENNSLSFQFNAQSTAKTISVGRASIYRAIDNLVSSNLIELKNKKIYIKNLRGLERNSK